jgi:hypothetical protein
VSTAKEIAQADMVRLRQQLATAERIAKGIPAHVPQGQLAEYTETDRTGRVITRFAGDPDACWGMFKQPTRLVTGWNTKFNGGGP